MEQVSVFAFGQCRFEDISYDLREAMLDRRVQFIEGEVARINLEERRVRFAHGDIVGEMPYDFLVLGLGRRLATERITGFFEHAHHLLGLDAAKRFGDAALSFHRGHAVIGYCPGARVAIPVFEAAFALSYQIEKRGERDGCAITIVSSETPGRMFGEAAVTTPLREALKSHQVEFVSNFKINQVTPSSIIADDGRALDCDLNMIVPPFRGPGTMLGGQNNRR